MVQSAPQRTSRRGRPPRQVSDAAGRPNGLEQEKRRERFERLATQRSDILERAFANFRKLADKEYYPHTEEDLAVIKAFLLKQVDLVEKSFKSGREISGGIQLSRPRKEQ